MWKKIFTILGTLLGGLITGISLGMSLEGKMLREQLENEKKMSQKHLDLYMLMNQWVHVKQENKSIERYLLDHGYKTIAIYGMSYVGETLIEELRDSRINISYGIDRKADGAFLGIDVYRPDEVLNEVDVVIVTSITFMSEIVGQLESKVSCPIISIEDILFSI